SIRSDTWASPSDRASSASPCCVTGSTTCACSSRTTCASCGSSPETMQFSERWLRTFVDPPLGSEELARLLTMSGVEVETLRPVAPPFGGVVVGEVLSVQKHPNADRLTVCSVDAGSGKPLTVVCGARNVAAGMKAPVALVGAMLPGGMEIKVTTMRGVESRGMLCSARELGLSEDHSGLLALPADAALGRDVREVLALDDR